MIDLPDVLGIHKNNYCQQCDFIIIKVIFAFLRIVLILSKNMVRQLLPKTLLTGVLGSGVSDENHMEKCRGVISAFSWGGQIFFLFFNATGLLKNLKKQHFICSNLTLFIVPFFLSFFFLFFSLVFLFFFLFSFFLFPWGATVPPAPLNDASGEVTTCGWSDPGYPQAIRSENQYLHKMTQSFLRTTEQNVRHGIADKEAVWDLNLSRNDGTGYDEFQLYPPIQLEYIETR